MTAMPPCARFTQTIPILTITITHPDFGSKKERPPKITPIIGKPIIEYVNGKAVWQISKK
jgi:hypothetical protein